jgi:hypothetical protein
MHWSRAAQGYLPWRHTSQWVPPKPELPAPVIVTPEPEAEEAAPRFRVGQVWRTRGGVECTVVHIRSDYLSQFPIYTDLYGHHHHSISGKSILSYGEDHKDDLVELISEPSAPEPPTSPIPEPAPAAPEPEPEPKPEPQLREDYTTCLNCYVVYKSSKSRCPNCGYGFVPEPEPEKATRGFLEFTRVRYQDGFIDCAIGTDHTAFIRFSAVRCFSEPDWVQVRPLPQPGEE